MRTALALSLLLLLACRVSSGGAAFTNTTPVIAQSIKIEEKAAPSEVEATPISYLIVPPNEAKLLAIGKEKFVEGCSGCHYERGDRLLPDGRRLCDIEFTEALLEEKVERRSHSYSQEDREAILVYVKSILTHPLIEEPAQ